MVVIAYEVLIFESNIIMIHAFVYGNLIFGGAITIRQPAESGIAPE